MPTFKYTNQLIHETSPYLLQHAHNPVNWYAWNKETLELAKKEHKLLLISIGYSSCHWCHVMEHESFENEVVAEVMNNNFINIKVDREERPDIDQIYMNAVQLITGRGGWPLNCVALPNGKPVWGGTYFPKENWVKALNQLAGMYKEKPQKIIEYAENLTEGVKNSEVISFNDSKEPFELSDLHLTVSNWRPFMDEDLGGRKGTPKFPMPNNYQFLLAYAVRSGNREVLNYVNTTLTKMANGGIFDQIGGGFSRYSVDQKWHVPHFEKMLYDNGQLVSLYAEAYQATHNELYKKTVFKTLSFVERELTNEEGAFYASLDADSKNEKGELEEGAFYVWKKEELQVLLKNEFELFSEYYNINYYGFWENDNYVLIKKISDIEFSKKHNISLSSLEEKVKDWQSLLLKERNKRPTPRLDDKSLTSWNALMLKGYVNAYSVFKESHFLEVALKNASFIERKQLQGNGSLFRSYKNGRSTIAAYLEDYATVIDAFISLYQVTFQEKWLVLAKQLTDYTFEHFFDDETYLFYFTSINETELITRKMEVEDNVISASNSIMAHNIFTLSKYFSNTYYEKVSKQMLLNVKENAHKYPSGYSNWLRLEMNFLSDFYEIAILGKEAFNRLHEIDNFYIPNKLIAGSTEISELPLLKNRFNKNETLIYVCVNFACNLPQKDSKNAIEQIKVKF